MGTQRDTSFPKMSRLRSQCESTKRVCSSASWRIDGSSELPLTLTAPEHMEVLAKQRRLAIPWLTDDSSTIQWEFVKGKQRCSVKIRSCLPVRDGIGLPEAVVG